MSRRLRWGVLSTAKIAREKVIPAMQRGKHAEITAIASRDYESAKATASQLGIPVAHGSYEDLLADPQIEAVYNPLPNHLHVPWSVKALEAGKHVLCEKPLAMTSEEARELRDASRKYPHLKVMEAFMYRFHPQWVQARQLVEKGEIGNLRTIQTFFSYFNLDPENIRNKPDIGGGALMDIGCYAISSARFLFGAEPQRIMGVMEHDPNMHTDRITSGILDFGSGTATFTVGTQLWPYQRVNIIGTEGRIEIRIPFNAPPEEPCLLWHARGDDVTEIKTPAVDQYTLQGDLFSLAVLDDTDVPTPIEDGINNMKAIEALQKSARSSSWFSP